MYRLKLVPDNTNWDFFRFARVVFPASMLAMVIAIASCFTLGFNFGIDFLGGTTIRTEASQPVDIGAYRNALEPLGYGDVTLTQVYDPTFRADQHVAQIRIQAPDDAHMLSSEQIAAAERALQAVDPTIRFQAVETVGPKVSGELVSMALLSLGAAIIGIMFYIWMRFEWQFGVAAVAALVHDAVMTIGVFSLFQIKFDLTVVAAVLTVVGYSINDTVVIFDRVRENLVKYKKRSLKDIVNLSLNETLSRTIMTTMTTFLALLVLLALGGDVIRGFSFAMVFGIFVGCYSTIFIASVVLIWLGVDRSDKTEKAGKDAAKAAP
ncbi:MULTISPECIES: protein translocase subunit SecF [Haematobacter]|uniref:Protein-export membrane protein SecF n=1 Tax=Haematobacter genomosp. 1 TaxID=366618 RepID=A0A212A9C2_9RHOB|nr:MULTISPECIES: protein translocase subunit SecF [Haematobacter]OWJ76327.1 protein translocase subunit SecF [Haematobacter genomosp. 1]